MGKQYSVDKLLAVTSDLPVVTFQVTELLWVVGDYDKARVAGVDTTIPILVNKLADGKWVTLDGYHRLVKVVTSERRKSIHAKIVSNDLLAQCVIN